MPTQQLSLFAIATDETKSKPVGKQTQVKHCSNHGQLNIFDHFIDELEENQDKIPFQPNMVFPEKQNLFDEIENKVAQIKQDDFYKHLDKVINLISRKTGHNYTTCFDIFLDYFGIAFGYITPHEKRCRISLELLEEIAWMIPEASLFYKTTNHVTDAFEDYLGTLFMMINSSKNLTRLGQFFTPAHVASMMAKMVIGNSHDDLLKVKICDPTSGSGVMLIAAWYEIRKHITKDKAFNGLFVAIDIDYLIYKLGMVNMRIHSVGWNYHEMRNNLLCYNYDSLRYGNPPEHIQPNSWYPYNEPSKGGD